MVDNQNNNDTSPNFGQSHVHEFLGSTQLAGPTALTHNHRFAGVTSEVIPRGNSHVHNILVNTDFGVGHLHEVGITTGPAIPVGEGRHIHLVTGVTTIDANHVHEYVFTTLIEDPLRQ
jgi:YmaF family